MRVHWLLVAAIGFGCSRPAKVSQDKIDPQVIKQEQEKLRGEWIGNDRVRLTITDDRFVEVGDLRNEGHYTLDPTSNPKKIDWYRASIGAARCRVRA